MSTISKIMVSLCMALAIVVGSKVNASESKTFLLPDKIIINIINKLSTNEQLGVHCKDKKHDLGFQTLQHNQTWSFKFRPNPFMDSSLYYCSFVWYMNLKRFDIYRQARDKGKCTECDWEIIESGPCRVTDEFRDCYPWKNQTQVVPTKQLPLGTNDNLGL